MPFGKICFILNILGNMEGIFTPMEIGWKIILRNSQLGKNTFFTIFHCKILPFPHLRRKAFDVLWTWNLTWVMFLTRLHHWFIGFGSQKDFKKFLHYHAFIVTLFNEFEKNSFILHKWSYYHMALTWKSRVYSYTELSPIVLSIENSQESWVSWAELLLLGQNLFIFCFFRAVFIISFFFLMPERKK